MRVGKGRGCSPVPKGDWAWFILTLQRIQWSMQRSSDLIKGCSQLERDHIPALLKGGGSFCLHSISSALFLDYEQPDSEASGTEYTGFFLLLLPLPPKFFMESPRDYVTG